MHAVEAAFRECALHPGDLERAADRAVAATLDALREVDDDLLVWAPPGRR